MAYTITDYIRDYIKEEAPKNRKPLLEDRLAQLPPEQLQQMSLDEALRRFVLAEVLKHWPFEEVLQKCLHDPTRQDLSPEEMEAYLLKVKNIPLYPGRLIWLDTHKLSPDVPICLQLTPGQRLYLLGFTPEQRVQGLSPDQRLQGLTPDEVLPHFSPEEIEAYLLKLKNQPSH